MNHRRGRMLALAAWLGLTAALRAEGPTLQATLKGHTEPVVVVAFSPDGKALVSRSMDATIRLWDVAAGTGAMLGEKGWGPAPVAFSPDGKTLVASAEIAHEMEVCDLAGGKCVTVGHGAKGAAAFSPDGKIVVQEDGKGGVRLRELATPFDPTTAKEPTALPGAVIAYPGTTQPAVAFSPDGKTLALKNKDGEVMLWDAASGTNTATLPRTGGAWFAFSPDGKTLVAACGSMGAIGFKDGGIKLFDAAAGKEIGTVAVGPNDPPFKNLVFSPDGKTLAGGSVYSVKVWDAAKGKALRPMERSPAPAVINPPVVYSPDGKMVGAGCTDAKVRLWDVASGKIVATLNGYTGQPAFSPDGTTLAVGCKDGTVQIYALPAARAGGK